MPVYSGYATQHGHGLGNVLGGLLRAAIPFAKNAAKSAAKAALNTGLNMLQGKHKKTKKQPKWGKVTKEPSKPIRKNKRKQPPGKAVSTAKRSRGEGDVFG